MLRFLNIWMALCTLLVACSAPVPAGETARGALSVDRVWTDEGTGSAYALVSYHNDTDRAFSQVVTIECAALDPRGTPVAVNQRSFFVHERGTINPGFTGTLEIPLALHGATAESADCHVAIAN